MGAITPRLTLLGLYVVSGYLGFAYHRRVRVGGCDLMDTTSQTLQGRESERGNAAPVTLSDADDDA